jgi:hypothetical protein
MEIKQLLTELDPNDETRIYTILTEDDRIFVGGMVGYQFKWSELPHPNEKNTNWLGDSPFGEDSE